MRLLFRIVILVRVCVWGTHCRVLLLFPSTLPAVHPTKSRTEIMNYAAFLREENRVYVAAKTHLLDKLCYKFPTLCINAFYTTLDAEHIPAPDNVEGQRLVDAITKIITSHGYTVQRPFYQTTIGGTRPPDVLAMTTDLRNAVLRYIDGGINGEDYACLHEKDAVYCAVRSFLLGLAEYSSANMSVQNFYQTMVAYNYMKDGRPASSIYGGFLTTLDKLLVKHGYDTTFVTKDERRGFTTDPPVLTIRSAIQSLVDAHWIHSSSQRPFSTIIHKNAYAAATATLRTE